MDYGGHYPQRVGDWLVVNDRLKYRFDDVHNPAKEHIHVKLDNLEYSWYRLGNATRHSNTYGLNSLSKTARKLLRKSGVSGDYFNKISLLQQNPLDYYQVFILSQPSYNLEVFPLVNSGYNLEVIPTYKDNNSFEIFGAPSLNLPTVDPFPMNEQGVQVLMIAGFVVIAIAAIALVPITGGASLALI